MALNKQNISKWYHMIKGDSILHVNQGIGRVYSTDELAGYYNDLTEKVTRDTNEEISVPLTVSEVNGEKYHFPIAIFQYGLGAYDLYLLNEDNAVYLEKVKKCADWAVENQKQDGSWEMYELDPGFKQCSAMAQGEAVSLLARAYKEFKNTTYLETAKKALRFMLIPVERGGPTVYDDDKVILLEYADDPVILNGMIFALWGIYDYLKVDESEDIRKIYGMCVNTLSEILPGFDTKYWSKYDGQKLIASPFYHRLHIAQLKVMYDITNDEIFLNYANKFEKYLNNKFFYSLAFVKKALQKIFE